MSTRETGRSEQRDKEEAGRSGRETENKKVGRGTDPRGQSRFESALPTLLPPLTLPPGEPQDQNRLRDLNASPLCFRAFYGSPVPPE